jgi:hypothetical protein
MPRFSNHFKLEKSQVELDFVDINTSKDLPVYVDPFAIEIRDDLWSTDAARYIRTFFQEVLDCLRNGDKTRAMHLMGQLREPHETFLGVSKGKPKGRGVGRMQASYLINALKSSRAFKTGMLTDVSEMALYVEGVDRDKISDLTTNVLRRKLVEYTQEQCALHDIPTKKYSGPPLWNPDKLQWISSFVNLPYVGKKPVMLIPKFIVRHSLALDGREFYRKQITDFLIEEHINANSSLVSFLKGKPKVLKKDVRERHPYSKDYISEIVESHPGLLDLYKSLIADIGPLSKTSDKDASISTICNQIIDELPRVESGSDHATKFHKLTTGALTTLFFPALIDPKEEWSVNDGRKRIDICFVNASDKGFFAHRRIDKNTLCNVCIIECKNYSNDISNSEVDQLLGRFTPRTGKFGMLICRKIDDPAKLTAKLRDAARDNKGTIIALDDAAIVQLLSMKARLADEEIELYLNRRFRELLA